MDRLTREELGNTDGKELVMCIHEIEDCNAYCQHGTCIWMEKANKRLWEYENTGLTPEKIREMDVLYAEMCKQVPRWIPVSERLPDDLESIIFTNQRDRWVRMGYYNEITQTWFDCRDDVCTVCVTHWMQLPEQYKEE